jgi:hypothetical protein
VRWLLVNASGAIVREAEAGSLAEARFRLAPLNGCQVLSHDSYQLGRDLDVRPTLTVKLTPRKQGPHHWGINELRRRSILAANVEGISDAGIAAEVGTSAEAVRQIRITLGLPNVAERRRMVIRAYWTLGWSDRRIAARMGIDAPRVLELRARMGLRAHRTKGGVTNAQRAAILGGDYAVESPRSVALRRTFDSHTSEER